MKTVQPHDVITQKDIRELADVELDVCVSFHLPASPTAPESHQNATRLKNMLDEAETTFAERNLRRSDIEALLKPARNMLDDEMYWTHQSHGLSIFLADNFMRKFRLPGSIDQIIEISRQFVVTPLISMLRPGKTFYILAVSQNSCRLFRGTQFQVEEVEVDDMPHDLKEALGWWRERNLNFYAYRNVRTDNAMFHGHEENIKEIDIEEYFHRVTDALQPVLYEYEASLVFAGVEELFPIFQDACKARILLDEFVKGNPDQLSAEQLHQKAWPIVDRKMQQQAAGVKDVYYERLKQDQASDNLSLIVPACRTGLVETLYVASEATLGGYFDREQNALQLDGEPPRREDIINLAAVFTLRTGGDVLAVPKTMLPSESPVAAILRVPTSAVGV